MHRNTLTTVEPDLGGYLIPEDEQDPVSGASERTNVGHVVIYSHILK